MRNLKTKISIKLILMMVAIGTCYSIPQKDTSLKKKTNSNINLNDPNVSAVMDYRWTVNPSLAHADGKHRERVDGITIKA